MPIYRAMCDAVIANDGVDGVKEAAQRIMGEFDENFSR